MTSIVKASDPGVKASRESACDQVLTRFRFDVPGTKLLCFVDDVDCEELKTLAGKANRGIFVANFGGSIQICLPPLPAYVSRLYDESRWTTGMGYTSVIYIHGSTCEPIESLILTLAHEPQHFTQFTQHPNSYFGDFFLTKLLGNRVDCASEYDAPLKSKSVAAELCGAECTVHYAQSRIEVTEDADDIARWQYFLSLPLTYADTFAEETRLQCQQHRERLHNMIAGYSDWYRKSFPIDFNKPDWWED